MLLLERVEEFMSRGDVMSNRKQRSYVNALMHESCVRGGGCEEERKKKVLGTQKRWCEWTERVVWREVYRMEYY